MAMHEVYGVMGVAGSGKTTIGKLLAEKMGCLFVEGDDFHSAANKAKMASGKALTDVDREAWLTDINAALVAAAPQQPVVLACSALKEKYRTILSQGLGTVRWICLVGETGLLRQRLVNRKDHFMPPVLLDSQLAILEIPQQAWTIDMGATPESIVENILQHMNESKNEAMPPSALGIIGLGVMGKSLARNAAEKNIALSVYNRFVEQQEEQVAARWVAEDPLRKGVKPFEDLALFVQSLAAPRKIILMVNAGPATLELAEKLAPLLAQGDMVIDAGNSHYAQTEQLTKAWAAQGLHWLGVGISGGEKGAYSGPAVFAGGEKKVFEQVRPLLETLAAKDFQGHPCCFWAGTQGAGHFAKMVHNGIEYAEMELLAEVYQLLKNVCARSTLRVATMLKEWQGGTVDSYLLDITIQILLHEENGEKTLDQILDRAEGKGTGTWALNAATDLGLPATLLAAAVQARQISAQAFAREKAQIAFDALDKVPLVLTTAALLKGYALARMVNHQQGFDLLTAQAKRNQASIDLAALAASWTNGCIIRSRLAQDLATMGAAADQFLWQPHFETARQEGFLALRQIVVAAVGAGIALPAFHAAYLYLQSLATKDSPMNLVQAQRDFFGAHGYQRKDNPQGPSVHTQWEPI
ncbi:MAG: NADP-dependent phosphogluconate dehydrogenase [Sphingobacteriia bacterium]|nr:MAG: NADP-dependent phosphogluconate dehydrogenase [Sphingobacteriia bacterium]